MRPVDIIRKKRDGGALEAGEIAAFVRGAVDGTVPDYQIAAFLMAAFIRGLDEDETFALTDAMAASGDRSSPASGPRPRVDKHSTGGVGDKTTLVAVPLAAACGVFVPKMSGRALGDTGGTIDKLESIPGFRTELPPTDAAAALERVGAILVSQTASIAPADKTLYALRDVTATVDSVPLICASVMSKKIAEGLDALVLDVKVGRGAFVTTLADAERLARQLVAIGERAGIRTEAMVSSMDVPLGRAVGNALEVREAIATLQGRGPEDVEALSIAIAAAMVRLGGLAATDAEAVGRVRRALSTGAALGKLRAIVTAQHGDPRVIDDPDLLPRASDRRQVCSPRDGYLQALDAGRLGRAASVLGAGRTRAGEPIDHAVGIVVLEKPGARVTKGQPLLEVHHARRGVDEAERLASEAIVIGDSPPEVPPLVQMRVDAQSDAA